MAIHLVLVTYNRLDYTKLSLASILRDPMEEFSLTIWDNVSTNATVEYLKPTNGIIWNVPPKPFVMV